MLSLVHLQKIDMVFCMDVAGLSLRNARTNAYLNVRIFWWSCAVLQILVESEVWMSNASIREARRIIVVCTIPSYTDAQLHRVNVLMVAATLAHRIHQTVQRRHHASP